MYQSMIHIKMLFVIDILMQHANGTTGVDSMLVGTRETNWSHVIEEIRGKLLLMNVVNIKVHGFKMLKQSQILP